MERITVPTYTATIYIGLKYHYDGLEMGITQVTDFIQNWVNGLGMCVSVTRTYFHYTGGGENGLIIGFINYPRFPAKHFDDIKKNALDLAEKLTVYCKQYRITVVFPDETIMINNTPELEIAFPDKCQCIGNKRQYISGNLVYCEGCNRQI